MMAAMPLMGQGGESSAEGQTSSSNACPEAFKLDDIRFALEALSVLWRYKDWAVRHCCTGVRECGMATVDPTEMVFPCLLQGTCDVNLVCCQRGGAGYSWSKRVSQEGQTPWHRPPVSQP